MATTLWTPGQRVKITGPRLIVRSLALTDLDDSLEKWTGSESRTAYIWKPDLSMREYMSGLIQYCDNKETFILGIWSLEEECMVGYRKVQITTEDHGRGPERTAIPTTVIGEAWAGHAYGQEAGNLANWFLTQFLEVRAIGARIYEANEVTWRLAERVGYQQCRTSEEKSKDGTRRKVRHYVQFVEDLDARFGDLYPTFKLDVLE